MALGKPIVQFDLAEKILYFLDRLEERAKMGVLGKRCVEDELEWRHEEPKLLAAYDMLFGVAK